MTINFTCFGLPTCTGVYSGEAQDEGCTNTFAISGGFTLTGLNLSPGASLSGTLQLQNDWTSNSPPISGPPIACTYAVDNRTFTLPYAGTWTGTSGTIFFDGAGPNNEEIIVAGGFYADVSSVPPAFPITVTGSITPTVANVQAQIQFRPQDVGTNASVFVFALAPQTIVRSAAAKTMHFGPVASERPNDAPVPCVLAQVGSDGLLHAVPSASSLAASISTTLTSQGAAVNVLNNVATSNVAGATMFVGYGPDGNTMVNSGVNATAVTVPGAPRVSRSRRRPDGGGIPTRAGAASPSRCRAAISSSRRSTTRRRDARRGTCRRARSRWAAHASRAPCTQ